MQDFLDPQPHRPPLKLADFPDPVEVRRILACRTVKDYVGVPIDFRLTDSRTLPAVTALVAGGFMVWLERLTVSDLKLLCDIYILTPEGRELCDAEGIKQH